jgi:hypothetical protein
MFVLRLFRCTDKSTRCDTITRSRKFFARMPANSQMLYLISSMSRSLVHCRTRPLYANRFAECCARQRKAHSIKVALPTVRQKQALGKVYLCRVPSSQQSLALGKDGRRWRRSPTVTLCRVTTARHSAKNFFFQFLWRMPWAWLSAKTFFAECQAHSTRQRFFFLFIPKIFL